MKKLISKATHKVSSLLKKKIEPPSYEYKRAEILDCKNKFQLDVLVETGTFLGDTVEFFKTRFKRVISIELAEKLADDAKKRFEKDANVSIIQGDSGKILKTIVNEIKEPILFWLDGHYSSEFFIGDVFISTAKGEKNTPVQEELHLIFKSGTRHVILIDDARLFTGSDDYPKLQEVKKLVKMYNPAYTVSVKNDIIYILPPIN